MGDDHVETDVGANHRVELGGGQFLAAEMAVFQCAARQDDFRADRFDWCLFDRSLGFHRRQRFAGLVVGAEQRQGILRVADDDGAVGGNSRVKVFGIAVGGGERAALGHPDLRRARGFALDRENTTDELPAVFLGLDRLEGDLRSVAGSDSEVGRVLLRAAVEVDVVDDDGHRVVEAEAADGFQQQNALAIRGVGVVEERGADRAVVEGDGKLFFVAVATGGGGCGILIADGDAVAGQHLELLVFPQGEVVLRHRHE